MDENAFKMIIARADFQEISLAITFHKRGFEFCDLLLSISPNQQLSAASTSTSDF